MKMRASDEAGRKRRIEMAQRRWSKPGERERMAALQTDIWGSAEKREQQRAASVAIMQRPDVKAKHSAAVGSAAARARVSDQMKLRWATDEGYRAKMIATSRAWHGAPEAVAKFRALMRALWSDPLWRMRRKGSRQAARESVGLVARVARAVPYNLPVPMRADVCQDVLIALLEGTATLSRLDDAVEVQIAAYRRLYPDLKMRSLDAPVSPRDERSLREII
jgi:hypothetical protein